MHLVALKEDRDRAPSNCIECHGKRKSLILKEMDDNSSQGKMDRETHQ